MDGLLLWVDKPDCPHRDARPCDECRDAALRVAFESQIERHILDQTGGYIRSDGVRGWMWECCICGVISHDYQPQYQNALLFAEAVSADHACRCAVV